MAPGRNRNKLKYVAHRTTLVQVEVNTDGEPNGIQSDTGTHTFWAWQSVLLRNHLRYPLNEAIHWKQYPIKYKDLLWLEMQENAEKNLDNRVDHPHPNHHMGSRGYPALTTLMILAAELENRALPDDFEIWNRFDEKVIEFTNEDESTPESQRPTSTPRHRAWDFVNDEKNSTKHRLGKGSGPTITMLSGIQKFVNEEMITKLRPTQHELQMTKEDLSTTQLKVNEDNLKVNEDKMSKMQAFLEAKFSSQSIQRGLEFFLFSKAKDHINLKIDVFDLAGIWVAFYRKYGIEPRNPEAYFGQKCDFLKNKVRLDFVREGRQVKRKYDEFKVGINSLPESIRRRSDAYNAHEELRQKKKQMEMGDNLSDPIKVLKGTWMSDGSHWPGTWSSVETDHSRGDHAGIIQTMLAPPNAEPVFGTEADGENLIDTTEVDTRLPMLVYVSREKRPGYDHNKKVRAMNALVRTSAIMSNGPFILNLDCDHYIYNSMALREGMCFMLDWGGNRIRYVQFLQGIYPSDRYANHNIVSFDVSMRALDGLQGPINSTTLAASIPVVEYQGRLLQDLQGKGNQGRLAGSLAVPREPLDAVTVAEAIMHFPALPASVVRLTGASDCLVGGALAALCVGLDVLQSVAVGVTAAKAAVELEPNEHLQSEGELTRLLQLLEELNDSHYWGDGCTRVIFYYVLPHFVKTTKLEVDLTSINIKTIEDIARMMMAILSWLPNSSSILEALLMNMEELEDLKFFYHEHLLWLQ
uniref:Glycosyltransferase 2 family n=1 Tax=Paeonia suffruticosa TaxID=45171 RepID=A0AB38Z7E5_PAESU